ncbi:hypothetical protein [Lentilactobacillus hilgardii]|uniref:hypothetical protein n=1 Tax=Lentilactobacillus hilgardii TaxID=1588 RepID=UPI001266509E|nr:hypothetical protein [Lentilactobacillus hilgardii]
MHNIPLDTEMVNDSLENQRSKELHLNDYYNTVKKYKNIHDKNVKKQLSSELKAIKSRILTSFNTPEKNGKNIN